MKVDVLMVVHNEEARITYAVSSLLSQTYSSFTLYVLDDGNTDSTAEQLDILAEADSRIVFLRNSQSLGLAAGLNKLIGISSADLIFRMDGDDISHPERLEKQIMVMNQYEHVDILGCNCRYINKDNGAYLGNSSVPSNNEEMLKSGVWNTWFIHPTVVFRRRVFDHFGMYDESLLRGQDSELWYRLVGSVVMMNMKESMLD